MSLVIKWAIHALLFVAVANLVSGIHLRGFVTALLVALVWGLLTAVVKPLLVILTLPVNILTLGLFTFVINAFLFWLAASIVPGFAVAGFMAAFWGALVLSVFQWIVGLVID